MENGKEQKKPKTKHLTIMFTDIKGFTSRTSMQSREELNRLLYVHDDLIRPIFEKYHGKVVKTIGDAFMVIFDVPTDAVLCGIKIQNTLKVYNKDLPKKERIEVRVAINSGEVNVKDEDVFGEPVNIAARIESIAQPGTVYFTEAVYLAMNKAEVPSSEVGRVHLKGIPERIKVYRVLEHPEDQYKYLSKRERMAEAMPQPDKKKSKGTKRYIILIIIAILLITLLAGLTIVGLLKVIGEISLAVLSGDIPGAAEIAGNFSGKIVEGFSRAVFTAA